MEGFHELANAYHTSLTTEKYTVAGGKIGPLTQWLYDTLTGIQWGKAEDPYGWTEIV